MIEIDIFTDLVEVDADGIGRVQAHRSLPHIEAGALLVAGQPDGWSWVRVLEVGKQFVTFLLVSEEEARYTRELEDMFVIVPADREVANARWAAARPLADGFRYSSDDNPQQLTADSLVGLLERRR